MDIKRRYVLLVFLATLLLLISCGEIPNEPVSTQRVLTQTPYPTYTPYPTFTPFVPSFPTTVKIDSLAKSFNVYFPGNYALSRGDATLRSGSLVAYDFIQVGEFLKPLDDRFISQPPYFNELQFHTIESIQEFIDYCNQNAPHEGESNCFLINDTDFISLYHGQQEAYYRRRDYENYEIQKFGHQYYFTRTRICRGGGYCTFREYTTFLRDSKVDVKIIVYILLDPADKERQAILSDQLFTSFYIELLE